MAATANNAAASAIPDHPLSVNRLFLPEHMRFDGKRLNQFKVHFGLLLSSLNIEYLIDTHVIAPSNAVLARDGSLLYKVLYSNVNEDAQAVVSEKASEGGKAAWTHFLSRYQMHDAGTTIALLHEYGSLTWQGGDQDSFSSFITKKSTLRADLRERSYATTDDAYAAHIIGSVPISYIPLNGTVDFSDITKLKSEDVIRAIQQSISIARLGSSETALAAVSPSTNKRPYRECGYCKAKGFTRGRINHLEKECRTKVKDQEEKSLVTVAAQPPTATDFAALSLSQDYCFVVGDMYKPPRDSINSRAVVDFDTWQETACAAVLDTRTWYADSGCSTSITPYRDHLINYEECRGRTVTFGNKSQLPVAGIGQYPFKGQDGKIYALGYVLHVPGALGNLLAIRAFTRKGCDFQIYGSTNTFEIRDASGAVLVSGSLQGRLYTCKLEVAGPSKPLPDSCLLADATLWHRRFGHASLTKAGLDVPVDNDQTCVDCIAGKFKRTPFNHTVPEATAPLEVVAADLFGPVRVPSHLGKVYMLVVTDRFSRYSVAYFLASKSAEEVSQCLFTFHTWAQTQTGRTLRSLHTDNGKEFVNATVSQYLAKHGIEHTTNAAYSSKRNGLVERRIGIIMDDARAMLHGSNLPAKFWALAASHSVYLRNRLSDSSGQSPYQRFLGRLPRVDHLRVFGCATYSWVPDVHRELGKLDNRAQLGIFVGFVQGTSNCRLYFPGDKTFGVARDVRFLENVFPADNMQRHTLPDIVVQQEPERDEPINAHDDVDVEDDFEQPAPHHHLPIPRPARRAAPQRQAPSTPVAHRTRARAQASEEPSPSPPSSPSSSSNTEDSGSSGSNQSPAQVELRADDSRGTVIHDDVPDNNSDTSDDPLALLASTQTPGSVRAALDSDDGPAWQAAIEKEMNAIESFQTYTLHNPSEVPPTSRLISSRLVLAVKFDPTGGDAHKLKARFCAKGFTQRPGIEYVDTFSPTGHRQSFRQFLSVVAADNMEVKGFDVSSAFLHGDLEEEVWMRFPPEVATGHRAGKVARLRKSLYGLKQAGKCWNDKLDRWLKEQGLRPNDSDACVYTLLNDAGTVQLMLYLHVDDSAIAGRSEKIIDDFAAELDAVFPCTKQGHLRHFLGMEIHRDRASRRIWVTQTQYMRRILDKFRMSDCNATQVPLSPTVELLGATVAEHVEACKLPYRELVGALQYLTIMTRPDISFAVNKLAQFNSQWNERHFTLAKGVLRYIKGTIDHGIALGGSQAGLVGYSDADHQGCLDSRRSTTGWAMMYRGGIIAWKSKRQTCISKSTAESELMAVDDAARDIVWERRGLEALGDKEASSLPTVLNVDNQAAIDISKNRTCHDSVKHIHAKYLHIRDLIGDKQISVAHIPGSDNPADIFTKPLPRDTFLRHATALGVSAPSPAAKWEN